MDNLWHEEDIDVALKVVIVGDGGVGKSSLIRRYCQGVFTSSYKKTIGVDFLEKVVTADNGAPVRLMLWDTAGQEEFDAITRAYYRGSNFCLLAFSTTDRRSLEHVAWWKEKVERECGPLAMMVVMTKTDLEDSSVVSRYEAQDLASSLDLELITTSSKEDVNINQVFQQIANSHFKTTINIPPPRLYSTRHHIGGWRPSVKTRDTRARERRLAQQWRRQQLLLEERLAGPRLAPGPGPGKPRSVQRRESQAQARGQQRSRGQPLALLNVRTEHEALEDMWEDPLLTSDIPLMLATKSGLYSLGLGRESSVDSPGASLRLTHAQSEYHGEDQDQWHSNLFSAASSPSLVQSSSRSTSRSQLFSTRDSEDSEDSAAQFLKSPMFDTIRGRGVMSGLSLASGIRRRRAKYSITGAGAGQGGGRCSIM